VRPLNFTVRRAMARIVLNLVAPIVALVCCAASVYLILPAGLRLVPLVQYGLGFRALILIVIALPSVVLGMVVALFLYPLILRPIVSGSEFWEWLGGRAPVNVPVVNRMLLRWYERLYGPRHV
jgi:ABC-type spermidine/putrescine transport system permease subunit II